MSKKDYLMIGKLNPNTFIGGVGGVITTKELLADKLSVTADQIQSFEIDAQNNVSCYIGVEYQITQYSAFEGDATITSYIDEYNLLTAVAQKTFRSTPNLREIKIDRLTSLSSSMFQYSGITFFNLDNLLAASSTSIAATGNCEYVEFKNVTSLGDSVFYNGYSCYRFYAPRCTKLGDSVSVNNNCFNYLPVNCIVYLDPSLWTVNAGSPDPDLQYLIDRGNDVRAVTNFDLPTIPINLTKVNDYGIIVDISWVQPIGSTNAIDYYQIYVNGKYKGRTASDETTYSVRKLEQYSFYTIQVVACDYFYNQSYSEILNIETGAAPSIPIQNIISEYKFENNVLDTVGSNNGVATDITYELGLIGQSAVFSQVTSNVVIPDADDLSFVDGFSDIPFSITTSVVFDSDPGSVWLIRKESDTKEYRVFYYLGDLYFRLFDSVNGGNIKVVYNVELKGATEYVIELSYNGSGNHTGLKMILNGENVGVSSVSGVYTSMHKGASPVALGNNETTTGAAQLYGQLGDTHFWNVELTDAQKLEIYNKQSQGIDINP